MSVAYATPMDMRDFEEWSPRRRKDELTLLYEENARLRAENEQLCQQHDDALNMPEGQPAVFELRPVRTDRSDP